MTHYYQDDHVTIYHGDCLEILPEIGRVGGMILDPPYSMAPNSVRGRDDGAAGALSSPVQFLSEVFDYARRNVEAGGAVLTVTDWRRSPDTSYLATRAGLRINTMAAWTRTRIGTGGYMRSAWDPVLVLSNGAIDSVDRSAIPNVVTANPPARREHPYEKPVDLWTHFTRRQSPRTILDPTCGVGTGLIAARRTGHKAIGIEIEERYCEIAARRMGQEVLNFGGAA